MKFILGFLILVGFSGCMAIEAPVGAFTNIKYPHSQAVADGVIGSKIGESGINTIFIVASFGDASVTAAAARGGITKIKTIDHNYFTIFGIYQRYTTIVTGE